jgi:hypothetical protein
MGGIKSINKSLKPRSMSRSNLHGKENRKEISAHMATHLPNVHNMSTASLLSNCNYEKKHSSVIANVSRQGSQKKLNFKVSSVTPSNFFMDRNSSNKKTFDSINLSDEEKLRRFHSVWEESKAKIM